MEHPMQLTFSNRRSALAVQVQHVQELPATLHELGLPESSPVLVLVGGASKMNEEELKRLRSFFVEGLVPAVGACSAAVIDGGTDAGMMHLMGQAHASLAASFPLIGVVPIGKVALPNIPVPQRRGAPLEPHHTHFVLVPGTRWGDESPWFFHIAQVLSASAPSLTILINGGEVAWKDVEQSVNARCPVLVVKGSGRTADALARAMHGEAADERVKRLVASRLLRVIDVTSNADEVVSLITKMLSTKG
jgi:SLOG in TRPM, prokaryote